MAAGLSPSRARPCFSRGTRKASDGSPSTRRMNLLIMRRAILPERYALPAAARGFARERLVGVHGHGPRDALEERQVVMRVAVAARRLELRQAAADAREPLVQAHELAFAEARGAGDAAGIAAPAHLGLGGDQV